MRLPVHSTETVPPVTFQVAATVDGPGSGGGVIPGGPGVGHAAAFPVGGLGSRTPGPWALGPRERALGHPDAQGLGPGGAGL